MPDSSYNLSVEASVLNNAIAQAAAAAPQSTTYTKTQTDALLAGKVDAVQGKGLSTNDYTTDEKNKLANLENYDDSDLWEQVNAVSDYGKVTLNKERTEYSSTINKLTFCCNMTATSDTFQLRQVGIIATSNAAIKYQLTLDTTPETGVTFVKTSDITEVISSTYYTWAKTSVSPGDTWYVVPFMKYDNGDDVYLKYGHLYSITVNNDGTLAIVAICKE